MRGDCMNISDRNTLGGDPAGKNQNVTDRIRADRTEKTAPPLETPKSPVENQSAEVNREQAPQDIYLTSDDRQKARELAGTIENKEEPPRDDMVKRAQGRVLSGYYNNEDIMGRLALSLVNTQQA